MLYSADSEFSMTISNTVVECYSSYSQSLAISNTLTAQTPAISGAFYIASSSTGVTSTSNTYRNCYSADIGGIYTLLNSKLSDSGSSFYQNSAIYGGVFKCEGCTISL